MAICKWQVAERLGRVIPRVAKRAEGAPNSSQITQTKGGVFQGTASLIAEAFLRELVCDCEVPRRLRGSG